MLNVTRLTAGYGGAPVVREVSLSLACGESLVLLGRNGCGKTTVLRALLGLLRYEGTVELGGGDVRLLRRTAYACKIAMLAQLTPIRQPFSVFDAVLMGRYAHRADRGGGSAREDREMAARCLADVGLYDLRGRAMDTLSGGQLQRVYLARAFCQDPEVLLLDEPTNHLDLKHQLELLDLLSAWRERGGIVCGATHDLPLATRFGSRALLLEKGRAVLCGATAEVLASDALRQCFEVDIAAFFRGEAAEPGGTTERCGAEPPG